MTIRFDIDYYDLRAYYRNFVNTNKSMIWRKWLLALFLPVMILAEPVISIFSSSPYRVDPVFWWMMVIISLVWIALVFIMYRTMPARLARKVMTNPENAGIVGYREMSFTDEEIRTKSDKTEGKLSWSAIVKAKDAGTHFLLFVNANQAYIIPKRAMDSGQIEELGSLLKAHKLL